MKRVLWYKRNEGGRVVYYLKEELGGEAVLETAHCGLPERVKLKMHWSAQQRARRPLLNCQHCQRVMTPKQYVGGEGLYWWCVDCMRWQSARDNQIVFTVDPWKTGPVYGVELKLDWFQIRVSSENLDFAAVYLLAWFRDEQPEAAKPIDSDPSRVVLARLIVSARDTPETLIESLRWLSSRQELALAGRLAEKLEVALKAGGNQWQKRS